MHVEWVEANGRWSVLVSRDGAPEAWLTVSETGDGIDRIFWVANPAKLDRIAAAVSARGTPGSSGLTGRHRSPARVVLAGDVARGPRPTALVGRKGYVVRSSSSVGQG